MIDGGNDYLRCSLNKEQPTSLHLFETDSFEIVRKTFLRGGRGKDGLQKLTYVKLCDMSNEWLKNTIIYNDKLYNEPKYNLIYEKELNYRKDNNIYIND